MSQLPLAPHAENLPRTDVASGSNTQMPDLVILPAHDPTAAVRLPGS